MRLRLPEPRLILRAVAMLALLAVFALAPASVPRNGVALAQTVDPPADTEPTSAGICSRTPQVRDAILSRLSDVSQCANVTGDHLASIDGELHLEIKQIASLRAGDFDGLTELRILELWYNRIEELPPGIFDQLTALEHLRLSSMGLGELPPGIFDQLIALERLELWDNQIEELPPGVFDSLTALEYLSLGYNRLSELPPGIFDQLIALERLELWENQIEALPPGVFDSLTALKSLSLGYNRLGELPDGIFDPLTALEYLGLWRNQIEELPPSIFDRLTALKSLDLAYNRLSELPDGIFDQLTALRRLFLNDNRLTTLPTPLLPNTAQGTPITRMMLNRNALADLPDRLFESDYSDYRALHLNDNPGTPFAFIIEGEGVGPSVREGDNLTAKVRYRVAQAAPVEMRARLSVTGGTASTSTVTIPAGRVHSEEITVTRSAEDDSVTLTLHDVSAHISSGDPVELYQVYRDYAGETNFENEFSGIRFVAGAPFTVPVPTPDRPTAMVINPGAVELDWNDTLNTQSYGVGMLSDGSWVELPDGDVQVAFRESGAVVTGLPDHPVYVFAARAKNRDGASGWSQHVSVASGQAATTTPTQPATTTTLPAPNTPTATLTPQDTVELDWQDVEDADSYAVRFLLDDQWVELPSDGVAVAVTGSSAVVSNLPDYDHYYFAVRAGKGAEKSGWSDWVKVSRPRPAPAPPRPRPSTVTVPCHFDLGTLAITAEPLSVQGSWVLECPAEGRIWSRTGIWYPRFYTFTLDRAYRVAIDLHSEDDTYLRLRTGRQTSGATVDENDGSSSSSDARIVRTLTAQTYTIEATTWPREERGDFTLSIQLSDVNAPAQQQQREPPSTDATLSGLTLSGVTLAFVSTTTDYAASVANDVTQTTVIPTTNDGGATYAIKLGGVADDDGTVPLAVGSNVITIEVAAEDGESTRTYTVTVTRAEPPAPRPAVAVELFPSGSVDEGTEITLTMSFANLESDSDTSDTDYIFRADVVNADACEGGGMGNDRYMYKVDDDPEVRAGTISASCAPGDYTVRASISSADNMELASAGAGFTVAGPAQQQQQQAEEPPPSTYAMLSGLTLSDVTLAFASTTTDYTASVANDVTQTTVTPTVNDDGATYAIKLGGVADDDGVVPLAVGSNVITVEVTAEDGETTQTYTVTVIRAEPLSTDATLKGLALSGVDIGAFDPATTGYTASVANDVTQTTVTPTINDDGATYVVKLGGVTDDDSVISLAVGSNVITIEVTAEDGKTARTYTVTVNRDAPPEPVEPEEESAAERSAWLESNPENRPFIGEWQHFTLRGNGLDKVDLSVNVIGFGGEPSSTGAVGYSTVSPPEAAREVCESAYYSGYQMSVDATFSLVGCREGTVVIELLDPDDDYALLKRYTVTVNTGP